MAIEDATVVRKADGSIDAQESYIIIQDQAAGVSTTSEFNVFEEDGIKVHYTGRLNVKWTFLKLFQSNYIPVTTKEFAGVEPYAKPEVKSSKEITDLENLYTTEITSVYPMLFILFPIFVAYFSLPRFLFYPKVEAPDGRDWNEGI